MATRGTAGFCNFALASFFNRRCQLIHDVVHLAAWWCLTCNPHNPHTQNCPHHDRLQIKPDQSKSAHFAESGFLTMSTFPQLDTNWPSATELKV